MSEQTAKKTPRVWHPQHEKVLKSWGESAACYRYLHYKSYQLYKLMNMRFTLPVIVISTVTGTANFAQKTFPDGWQAYVPSVIGALNLFAAIMTTVQQFLKISELMESHRVSSLNYGKLARNIKLEISLPVKDRSYHGNSFIDVCAKEYDRLLQQCPPVPGVVMKIFDIEFPEQKNMEKYVKFSRPELMSIKEINPYEDVIDQTPRKREKFSETKEALIKELEELRTRTLVSGTVVVDIPSHAATETSLNEEDEH